MVRASASDAERAQLLGGRPLTSKKCDLGAGERRRGGSAIPETSLYSLPGQYTP
jgi:hypothetical protein